MASALMLNAFCESVLHADISKAIICDGIIYIPNSVYAVLVDNDADEENTYCQAVLKGNHNHLIMSGVYNAARNTWRIPTISGCKIPLSTLVYVMSRIQNLL